jgi:hypothetical protein
LRNEHQCKSDRLCLSLLLSTLETTIVSTSLVSITNALSGFENRDWVVTSYLLTYTGNPPVIPNYIYKLVLKDGLTMLNRISGDLCEVLRHLRRQVHDSPRASRVYHLQHSLRCSNRNGGAVRPPISS